MPTLAKSGAEPIGAEEFAVAFDVVNAVGEENESIFGIQGDAAGGVFEGIEKAEGRVGFAAEVLEDFDVVGTFADKHGLGMTGVGVVSAVFGKVSDHVEGGGEERSAALAENGPEIVIHAAEEFGGIGGVGREFFDERADDGGDERGTDAVTHYVADENAGAGIGERANVEEVAADRSRGQVAVAE